MASLADSLRFSVACRRPPWTDEPRWHWKYENVFPSLGQPAGKGEVPSLAKEGTPRHQVNGPVPLEAGPGWFVQLPIIGGLNQPPRLRPVRRLRGIFLMGAATPPCPRRGLRLSLQLFSMPRVQHGTCGTCSALTPMNTSSTPITPLDKNPSIFGA